jgi:hypothetical protein
MKTLLSPDLDAQPLLLVDCEARSREALEKPDADGYPLASPDRR